MKLAVAAGKGYPPVGKDISCVSKSPSPLLSFLRLARNDLETSWGLLERVGGDDRFSVNFLPAFFLEVISVLFKEWALIKKKNTKTTFAYVFQYYYFFSNDT